MLIIETEGGHYPRQTLGALSNSASRIVPEGLLQDSNRGPPDSESFTLPTEPVLVLIIAVIFNRLRPAFKFTFCHRFDLANTNKYVTNLI